MAAGKLDLPADLLDAPKDKKLAEPGRNRNGASVHSGKKKLKEKAASGKASSLSNTSHATEHSLRITKAKGSKKDILEHTKNKKRKLEDKGIFAETSEGDAPTVTIQETDVLRGHKIRKSKSDAKKSKLLHKKIRKKDKNEINVVSESALPSSDKQNSDHENSGVKAQVLKEISSSRSTKEASNGKTSKGMKKKKMKKIIKSQGNQMSEKQGSPSKAEFEDVKEIQSIDEDCSRKKTGAKARVLNEISSRSTEGACNDKVPKRMKKEVKKITKVRGNQISEKQCSPSKAEFEDVDEIQSVDEDCSRGMKKWLIEYHDNRPGVEVLLNRIDEFITSYEEQKEQERKEREALAAEGGWTVVVHHKGRKKTTDSESGIAVGSVAQAAVVDHVAKKKSKEPPIDFYRFQKREAQRNEVMLLQSKFEQDKKRIQQLRAARKFRPY